MHRTDALRAAAAALAMASVVAGCKSGRRQQAVGPMDGSATDAALDARPGPAEASIDPTVPPDDSVPPMSSDELTARSRHLVEAIAKDDATLAGDILFPRDGWLTMRDAADPGHEWEKRVAGPFRRAVHALWRRRKDAASAQLVSIDLGHAMQQVTPQRHGWKRALWSVTGSRLTFVVEGRTHTLSIHEMTAWRGAWYVTRL